MGEADYQYSVYIKGIVVLHVLFLKAKPTETASKRHSGEAGQLKDEKRSSCGKQKNEAA